MPQYTKEELEEARRAIDSTLRKCEKVQPKLGPGTAQHTLLVRRIKAFEIALELIGRELEALGRGARQREGSFEKLAAQIEKPFLYVDYNELLNEDTVMLSQTDVKNNCWGEPVLLWEGLELVGYQEDEDAKGARDDLVMEGTCIRNQTGHWEHVKWLLKANEKGIRSVREILENGW